jgi:signal peptidase I
MNKKGEPKSKFAKFLKKAWKIIWKDDSFKGWLISLVFIFVVIKFLFFPILNLATGTSLPLAIVESCSMYHSGNAFGNFDNWWEEHDSKYEKFDINKSEFESFIMKKGFGKGDILFIVKAKPEKVKIGDVVIFNADQKNPIIHRIISIKQKDGKYIFSTIGDNNNGQLNVEIEISQEQLVGKALFRIAPSIGWVKLVFYENLRPQNGRGFCEEQ